ncbi:MAG: hypothetical protein FJY55_00470 [Betaproteobacteria bacterium]|nr:hypothetical protein [Betaproteobacteria bacterium]
MSDTSKMPRYEVLWPLARRAVKDITLNRRFADNGAKRIGFIWDYMFRGNDMFPLLQAGLAEKYPGSTFVPYEHFGNVHGHDEREVLAALPDRLREAKLDAVVVGVGA